MHFELVALLSRLLRLDHFGVKPLVARKELPVRRVLVYWFPLVFEISLLSVVKPSSAAPELAPVLEIAAPAAFAASEIASILEMAASTSSASFSPASRSSIAVAFASGFLILQGFKS